MDLRRLVPLCDVFVFIVAAAGQKPGVILSMDEIYV